MKITTRTEAKVNNLNLYFTGKPCKHGHIDQRYTSCGKCLSCQKIQSKKWNKNHKKYFEQWKADNPNWHRNYNKDRYRENHIHILLNGARYRAKIKNVPFNLKKDDVIIPTICPVLGITLKISENRASYNSPSIDRIIPKLGYVKDNILIISMRANKIKHDADIKELEKIYKFYKELLNEVNS